jgi:hypothetical protein
VVLAAVAAPEATAAMTPEEKLIAEIRYIVSWPDNTGSLSSRWLKRAMEHYDKGTDSPYIKYLAAEDEAYEINGRMEALACQH